MSTGPLAVPVASAEGAPSRLAGDGRRSSGWTRGISTLVGERIDLAPSLAAIARGPAFGVSVVTEVGMSGAPALDDSGRLVGVVIGAETASGTAIVAAVDDAASLADQVVVAGRCPLTA